MYCDHIKIADFVPTMTSRSKYGHTIRHISGLPLHIGNESKCVEFPSHKYILRIDAVNVDFKKEFRLLFQQLGLMDRYLCEYI